MNILAAVGVAAVLASLGSSSIARADQTPPSWWIVQQQIQQQQIQQQIQAQQVQRAIQQTTLDQLNAQHAALQAQRDASMLQLREDLDRQLETLQRIQQQQLLQILQLEQSPAPRKQRTKQPAPASSPSP